MAQPTELSERVKEAIGKMFASTDRAEVSELLLQYGTKDWHWSVERIHLDILSVSESSLAKVRELVALALTDYRDIVVLAEYTRSPDGSYVLKT